MVTTTDENIDSDDHTRFMLEHTYVIYFCLIERNPLVNKMRYIVFLFRYAWTWSLILSDVSDDDAGEYTCRVPSVNRTLTIIKRFNLTVLSKHRFLSFTLICDHTLLYYI